MRATQHVRGGWLLGVAVGCLLASAAARADVTTDRPGSILIFPKVVRDGTRDTLIQITNTGNLVNTLRCYYLDGEPGRGGAPLCSAVDFTLTLTRQQPTHWVAGAGRAVIPNDLGGGAGFDPGLIPPVPVGFRGALVCAEIDINGNAMPQEKLKGEATISAPAASTDYSKYNAVAVGLASPGPNGDKLLSLNNSEYSVCPNSLRMSFLPDGSIDPVIESYGNGGFCSTSNAPCNNTGQCPGGETCTTGQSRVATNLTLVPCNLDFLNGVRTTGTAGFDVYNEFEDKFSGTFPFNCWTSFNVGTLAQFRSSRLSAGNIGTIFAEAQIRPNGTSSPFVAVATTFHADSAGNVGASSVNLHEEGGSSTPNINVRLSD